MTQMTRPRLEKAKEASVKAEPKPERATVAACRLRGSWLLGYLRSTHFFAGGVSAEQNSGALTGPLQSQGQAQPHSQGFILNGEHHTCGAVAFASKGKDQQKAEV